MNKTTAHTLIIGIFVTAGVALISIDRAAEWVLGAACLIFAALIVMQSEDL